FHRSPRRPSAAHLALPPRSFHRSPRRPSAAHLALPPRSFHRSPRRPSAAHLALPPRSFHRSPRRPSAAHLALPPRSFHRSPRRPSAAHLALPRHASTIDHQRLAGDVASFLGGEEHGGVADVIGRLLALHRDDVGDALLEHLARRHPREGG